MSSVLRTLSFLTATWLLWKFIRWLFSEDPLRGIPGPPSKSFLTGNLGRYFNRYGSEFQRDVALNYGPVVRLSGPFGSSALYVADPLALQAMFVKDQALYDQWDGILRGFALVIGPSLLGTQGEHHRRQRKLLNPAFSTNSLRTMLPAMYETMHKLCDAVGSRIGAQPQEVDILHWLGRASLQMIGKGGMAHSLDSLVEERPNKCAIAVKSLLAAMLELSWLQYLLPIFSPLAPPAIWRKVLDMAPYRPMRNMLDIMDTLDSMAKEIFNANKSRLQGEATNLSDCDYEHQGIIGTLMKAHLEASEDAKVPEEEAVAQIVTFMFAGMETTSNTTGKILEYLAHRKDLQEKLRSEILEASNGEDLPYDTLMQLPLLNGVYREHLRLDPIAPLAMRDALADAVLPLSKPVRGIDGTLLRELPIAKGTKIIIGVLGSNTNKDVWGDDTLEFKPERWLSKEFSTTSDEDISVPGIYANLMTFAGGPRSCIGFKYAELQIKASLAVLLTRFSFTPSQKHIFWNVANAIYPTVGKDSNYMELPLIVQRLEGKT
ncbi:cytochrome P450 monooxygenase [Laetiporus sulphureus 93-53]|uniref:Cytochrome P450 monooxygenase n=1 Tax=Laetiporus sulphureus 93-53 TaxID=1314785 RepID=A0A165BDV0_9APHY|nr:cytochrome P450 monooxygenase [Laetiporus sulphureus 93-53]KZT00831.1 cytochrome P450 monooxygenase [Laetiporus sulphureus 93-53]